MVPAMNEKMWTHPATKSSIEKLKSFGVKILSPTAGSLACGEVGEGRMLEPEEIYELILPKVRGPKILITAGGTREPIDSVRYIGNISTGATAAAIADELISYGFEVSLLKSEAAVEPVNKQSCEMKVFSTFADFRKKLINLISKNEYAAVIHAAAVSDYSVAEVIASGNKTKKINLKQKLGKVSSGQELVLKLKPNPKLIDEIKKVSKNRKIKLIGFKLTATKDEKTVKSAVKAVFEKSKADVVVHNDVSGISGSQHLGEIVKPKGKSIPFANKIELAARLRQVIAEVTL